MFFLIFSTGGGPADDEASEIRHLVELAQSGHHDAFEDLVFRYRDQVYATAWHLTHNAEDSLDVTQEVFIRAYRALSSYRGNSRFGTWLHRIALNTGIDYIRREKRHRHATTDDITKADDSGREAADSSSSPTQRDQVYEAELQRQVMAALDQLSPRQKQVFILRYYHELDTKETASVLKCTEGAVKRHLFRAQKRLRELLRDLRMPNYGK